MTSALAFVLQAVETELQNQTGGPALGWSRSPSENSQLHLIFRLTAGWILKTSITSLSESPLLNQLNPGVILMVCFFQGGPPKAAGVSVRFLSFYIYCVFSPGFSMETLDSGSRELYSDQGLSLV